MKHCVRPSWLWYYPSVDGERPHRLFLDGVRQPGIFLLRPDLFLLSSPNPLGSQGPVVNGASVV